MTWQEIRKSFPGQWLLLEALKAHTENDMRILEQLAVVDTFPDGETAMKRYASLHKEDPQREMFVLHTDRDEPNIRVRKWLGIRGKQ